MESRSAVRLGWLPNALTLTRLLALPGAIACVRWGRPYAAVTVFLAAMLTDILDGTLARRLDARTVFGLYLDPVVDKVLCLGLFYELAAQGRWPLAVAHLFLARELLHSAVRDAGAARGEVIGANWMGKTKAAFQTGVIVAGLVPGAASPAVLRAAAWTTLALAWCFFCVFAWRNRRVFRG